MYTYLQETSSNEKDSIRLQRYRLREQCSSYGKQEHLQAKWEVYYSRDCLCRMH